MADASEERTVVVVFAAPIPVGHRVELTWFEVVRPGLVPGQERTDDREHQPVVRDLDTGVSYTTDWVVGVERRPRPDAPYRVGDGPRADARPSATLRGVVRACTVITIRGYPEVDVQTELRIAPDPG